VDQEEQDQEILDLEDISAFDQQELNLVQQIESKKHDIDSISNRKHELMEQTLEVESRKKEDELRWQAVKKELTETTQNLRSLRDEMGDHASKKEQLMTIREKHASKAAAKSKEIEKNEDLIKKSTAEIPASYNWTGPMHTDRSMQIIENDIKKNQKRQEAQSKNRSLHDVTATYHKAVQMKTHKDNELNDLEETFAKITKLHKNDKLRKRKKLKLAKGWAQWSFNIYLSSKAYQGQIVFDDKKMTMDPVVRTDMKMGDDEDKQSRCVPVRQLSGGERSFSSMCLVLALKAATQTPFLALDEFDVFMDERNRRLSLNILTDVCVCVCGAVCLRVPRLANMCVFTSIKD